MWVQAPPSVLFMCDSLELKWKCKECGCSFKSKNVLYTHRHNKHNLKFRNRNKICQYCGCNYDGRKREHEKICPSKKHGFHKWTNEEKKMLSEKRKKFLKENPDKHPWKKSSKFVSMPCERLKKILMSNYSFVEEYTDERWHRNYSLDIAFLDKKLAIEINGNQHYDSNGELNKYYQERHDFLKSNGWIVLEIHYSWCYKDDKINEILNAIENCSEISLEEHKLLFSNRRKTKQEKQIDRKENDLKLVNERKEMILNSGVDLKKFGWITKVSKIIGLTPRQIYRIIKITNLKEIVYLRDF